MMSFPVLQVQNYQILDDEQLGTKDKFWFQREIDIIPEYNEIDVSAFHGSLNAHEIEHMFPGTELGKTEKWLFKIPRPETGEHWAEKIASEIAAVCGIQCAIVEFAECEGRKGTASKNFVKGDEELRHGNEILAGFLDNYDIRKKFGHQQHTLANIISSVSKVIGADDVADIQDLFDYLVLDALICNTDRHHENWGILRSSIDHTAVRRYIAPTFDHASSLGRELTNDKRRELLARNQIEKYVISPKARGGIFLTSEDKHGINPFLLLRNIPDEYQDCLKVSIQKTEALTHLNISAILDRIPSSWITSPEKEFAESLLRWTSTEIKKVVS